MRAHDHSRSAVTALKAVFFPETFLQWMELSVFGHAFDRHQIRAVSLDCKHGAGFHGQAIRQDRAGATDAGLTTDVRARQSGHIANEMRQKKTGLDVFFVQLSIDRDLYVHTYLLSNSGERGRIV